MKRKFKRLKYDVTQCSSCLNCVMNCAQSNSGVASPSFARIRVELAPFTGDHELHHCRQCATPECMEACEYDALQRDPATYAVVHMEENCTQCGACVEACSFNMMILVDETGDIIKCDLCSGDPVCVDSCLTGALQFEEEEVTTK